MGYVEALEVLMHHASIRLIASRKIESAFFMLIGRSTSLSDIARCFREILSCLEVVNIDLNGARPADTPGPRNKVPERILVLAMSAISSSICDRICKEYMDKPERPNDIGVSIATLGWAITLAWGAVLEGDICPIEQLIRDSGVTSGYMIDWLFTD